MARERFLWDNDRMKALAFVCLLLSGLLTSFSAAPATAPAKIRVLIVTGGHGFQEESFFAMFAENPDISVIQAKHPEAQRWFGANSAAKYDVIVMYDMYQPITDEVKTNLISRLKEGKGLVVLHHAIANYQDWPEYRKIIGGRYYLNPTTVDGVAKPTSTYRHDVDLQVVPATTNHPVVAGIGPFEIHDETYKGYDVDPDVTPLLTTKHPDSSLMIGWAKTYNGARVVCLQGGHDRLAYENPNLRKLIRQAINWTAGRS